MHAPWEKPMEHIISTDKRLPTYKKDVSVSKKKKGRKGGMKGRKEERERESEKRRNLMTYRSIESESSIWSNLISMHENQSQIDL